PKWHLGTSSRGAGVFNSFTNVHIYILNAGILCLINYILCFHKYFVFVSISILFISHGNGIYVSTVHMAMRDARYKLLGGGQYPSEYDEDAPVPPALPVPF